MSYWGWTSFWLIELSFDLTTAKVSFHSGIVINMVQEDEECSDSATVLLRRDWMVQMGHLNCCPVHVDGFEGKGVYFIEATFTTKDLDCFLTAQIVRRMVDSMT